MLTRIGKHFLDLTKLSYIGPILFPSSGKHSCFHINVDGNAIKIMGFELDESIEQVHEKLTNLFQVQDLGSL